MAGVFDRFLAQLHRNVLDFEIDRIEAHGLSWFDAVKREGCFALDRLLGDIDAKVESDIVDRNGSIAGSPQRLRRCLFTGGRPDPGEVRSPLRDCRSVVPNPRIQKTRRSPHKLPQREATSHGCAPSDESSTVDSDQATCEMLEEKCMTPPRFRTG